MYVCITESLCYIAVINTELYFNHTSIKIKSKTTKKENFLKLGLGKDIFNRTKKLKS